MTTRMSLSTVFSLLTSSSSSPQSEKTTEDEDIINITSSSISSTKSGATFPTTTAYSTSTTNIITSGSTGPTGESYQSSSASTTDAGESNLTTFSPKSTTSSFLDEDDYFNETINIKNNSTSYNYSSTSSRIITIPESSTSTPANELDFDNLEDDASVDLFSSSSSTTDINGVDNLDKVESEDEKTYVPLFYFLVTILLGIYVYLYFLSRHLKNKALRGQDDDAKKKHEERLKRGGCQYDFEDEEESDYGPQQQNLSVAALSFYGGGSRK